MTPTVDSSPLATLCRVLVKARKTALRVKHEDKANLVAVVELALKVAVEMRP